MHHSTETRAAVVFDCEVDRTYINVPRTLTLVDGAARTIVLQSSPQLPDAVVWNPWAAKSLKMAADFGPEEYKVRRKRPGQVAFTEGLRSAWCAWRWVLSTNPFGSPPAPRGRRPTPSARTPVSRAMYEAYLGLGRLEYTTSKRCGSRDCSASLSCVKCISFCPLSV